MLLLNWWDPHDVLDNFLFVQNLQPSVLKQKRGEVWIKVKHYHSLEHEATCIGVAVGEWGWLRACDCEQKLSLV